MSAKTKTRTVQPHNEFVQPLTKSKCSCGSIPSCYQVSYRYETDPEDSPSDVHGQWETKVIAAAFYNKHTKLWDVVVWRTRTSDELDGRWDDDYQSVTVRGKAAMLRALTRIASEFNEANHIPSIINGRWTHAATVQCVNPVCAWGEYPTQTWKTVTHFCEDCIEDRFYKPLQSHVNDCGCSVNVRPRFGYRLPSYITRTSFSPEKAKPQETKPQEIVGVEEERGIQFGTLLADGTLINVRSIKQSDIMQCPHVILAAEHYREDGSCRCNDPDHLEMIEWEYTWNPDTEQWD